MTFKKDSLSDGISSRKLEKKLQGRLANEGQPASKLFTSEPSIAKKRRKLIIAGVPKTRGCVSVEATSDIARDTENVCDLADDGTPLGGMVVQEPLAKKKKKKVLQKKKNRKEPKCGISVKSCSEYLHTWKTDRSNWRFIKVRQTWLLQHMYDDDKVSDDDFKVLTDYLEALKGQARETTIQKAESILSQADVSSSEEEEEEDKDEEEKIADEKSKEKEKSKISEKQQTRAKDILQLLS